MEGFGTGEEVGRPGLKGCGEFEDVGEAGVAFAPLDPTDVSSIEIGQVGECFLGDPEGAAPLAHGSAESDMLWRPHGHACSVPSCGLLVYGL